MNSDKANEIRHQFESALSAIIPAIAQATQQYQVSGAFETKLKILPLQTEGARGCIDTPGGRICGSRSAYPNTTETSPEALTPDPECEEQFWTNIESTLSSTIALLGESIENTDQSFEVHLSIETAALNSEQPVVCEWGSDRSHGNILQCSKL